MKILIVGNRGGTNIGSSFLKSAEYLGLVVEFVDSKKAQTQNRIIDSFFWRFLEKRFPLQCVFNFLILRKIKSFRPDLILTTGHNPVTAKTLVKLRLLGIVAFHFSSDDPWNIGQRAGWFLNSLTKYNYIFTPRESNIEDFVRLGCVNVQILNFGFDEFIFANPKCPNSKGAFDVLFVGGGDEDRRSFFNELKGLGISFKLVGGYWDSYPELAAHSLGPRSIEEIIELTLLAKVNICLVRRANRDGHVMRSYEIGAIGGVVVMEDTIDHREIYGNDGFSTFYFKDAISAANRIQYLLGNAEQRKLFKNNLLNIEFKSHTYTQRLIQILKYYAS